MKAGKEAETRIAFQVIHKPLRGKWFILWDWFEYLCDPVNNNFDYDQQFSALQASFSRSVFGGPTSYSLIKAAAKKHIPVTYLWDEGLFQYGYGKNMIQVSPPRLTSTPVDSDFTCRKDDCKAFYLNMVSVPDGEVVFDLEEALEAAGLLVTPWYVNPWWVIRALGSPRTSKMTRN